MCKVFAMTNMSNVKVNSKFLNTVKNELTKRDNDGFGYAVLGKKGALGGERTMKPELFRPLRTHPDQRITYRLPFVLKSSNRFGTIDRRTPKSFIAHGRFSTNDICLGNTHPFTNGEVALVHNGVVQDCSQEIENLVSTCDTEILLRYWERGGITDIEQNVSGYYAVAILDKNGLLHVARDDRAMLYVCYSKTVDSYIFATTADILEAVAKEMKWKIENPEEMLPNSYCVFDGNKSISSSKIEPLGSWSAKMTDKEKKSLGITGSIGGSTSDNWRDRSHSTYPYSGNQWGDDYPTASAFNERPAVFDATVKPTMTDSPADSDRELVDELGDVIPSYRDEYDKYDYEAFAERYTLDPNDSATRELYEEMYGLVEDPAEYNERALNEIIEKAEKYSTTDVDDKKSA